MKPIAARNVNEYLATVPQPARASLEKLRTMIQSAAPDAEEVISCRIPTFRLRRLLVGFAAFEDHGRLVKARVAENQAAAKGGQQR